MIRSIVILLSASGFLAACADPTGYKGSENVVLRVMNTGVEIQNDRTRPIHYFLTERSTAARILWGPCDDPRDCTTVAAGARVGVSGHDIIGWGESEEVILYWWHLIPRGDGKFRVDSVRHVVGAMR
jgi:hypothetical protein